MKKHMKKTALRIDRETIRVLDASAMQLMNGGVSFLGSCKGADCWPDPPQVIAP
jgi:hypothetical protein